MTVISTAEKLVSKFNSLFNEVFKSRTPGVMHTMLRVKRNNELAIQEINSKLHEAEILKTKLSKRRLYRNDCAHKN